MAANSLIKELTSNCNHCRHDLDVAYQRLVAWDKPRLPATVSAIYRDLLALSREFEHVEVDLSTREVAVTTDPIVLDDVFLGDFEIRLSWDDIGDIRQPYRVIARDPHPSAKRSDVTHPHVQDEHLCEGEGSPAIAAALTERRIFDFFLLVDQVLHTYGRGSTYVELSDWTGVPCESCGANLMEDEQYECRSCGDVCCDECTSNCQGCDESFCSGCLVGCAECSDSYCGSCLAECRECRQRCCKNCLQESGFCGRCDEQQAEEQENEPTEDLRNESVAAA
jgi:hypothetical protein